MKTAIFVIGKARRGKASIIRTLTGQADKNMNGELGHQVADQ